MTLEQIAELKDWIVACGLAGTSEDELVRGLCERLVAADVPLQRVFVGLDTLHPIVEGRGIRWDRGGARQSDYTRAAALGDAWLRSPLYRLESTGAHRLRRRLDRDYLPGEFPVVDELRAEGVTDYVAYRSGFGEPEPLGQIDAVFSSWATGAPDGFKDHDLAVIEALLPALALVLKLASATWAARSLMETYLGRDAGRRVLCGEIERGATQALRAVIWLSDLRGFTRIADALPREQLVPLLNDYADCLATAVHEHGGQVLKFMGDGVLATFELDQDGAACTRALDAAEAAQAGAARLNATREAAGLPTTWFGLALHVGDVLYGNIGSADRLDFTVVGPAVNEAARIEAMCGALEQTVIVSQAFAAAAPGCRGRLVSLGRYMLRGVSRPQELFTLDPDRGRA